MAPDDRPLFDPYAQVGAASTPPVAANALHPVAAPEHRGFMVIGLVGMMSLVGSAAVVAWGVHEWRRMASTEWSADPGRPAPEATTQPLAAPSADPGHPSVPAPAPSVNPKTTASAAPSVPDDTRYRTVGQVEVVDIGLSSIALKGALLAQRSLARSFGQTLVLMITGTECGPCRGVDDALTDPRMQRALSRVRLVRVDLRAFREEIAALHMPTHLYPAFFLLDDDLRPRDGIHGGEWDDDVPENIAPVLGAFVRGEYRKRRHGTWAPSTGGVQL